VVIPCSSQKPKKATLSGDLFWYFGGGGDGDCQSTWLIAKRIGNYFRLSR